MPNSSVDKRVFDGLTEVTLAGEVDLASVPELARELTRAPAAARPDVAVDMHQVTFMDCSVLGILMCTLRDATTAGGCVRLIGVQRPAAASGVVPP